MIILDTNVVSEPLKAKCSRTVLEWLDNQVAETLFLTSTNLAELLLGLEIMAAGKRKKALDAALGEHIAALFGPRILPFDDMAAKTYAVLVGRARAAGHAISVPDGQIAAIAAAHGLTVSQRDTAPFSAAGVTIIDPWLAY